MSMQNFMFSLCTKTLIADKPGGLQSDDRGRRHAAGRRLTSRPILSGRPLATGFADPPLTSQQSLSDSWCWHMQYDDKAQGTLRYIDFMKDLLDEDALALFSVSVNNPLLVCNATDNFALLCKR